MYLLVMCYQLCLYTPSHLANYLTSLGRGGGEGERREEGEGGKEEEKGRGEGEGEGGEGKEGEGERRGEEGREKEGRRERRRGGSGGKEIREGGEGKEMREGGEGKERRKGGRWCNRGRRKWQGDTRGERKKDEDKRMKTGDQHHPSTHTQHSSPAIVPSFTKLPSTNAT